MAESNTNNQANVSSAKGVKGGYIFSAPVGTATSRRSTRTQTTSST